MKPTFIGIGAQKCASSWIYDILADHPQVSVSNKKELDYFSYHYEHGQAWYENHFQYRPGVIAVGEISPSYFNEASVPKRVRLYNSGARILLSLRDPVQRALSQHRHLVRIGLVTGPDFSFETAIDNNPSYIEQGMYATHIRNWLKYFHRDQIHIVLMEDIVSSSQISARSIYQFLDVNDNHVSKSLNEKSNPSYVARSQLTSEIVTRLRKGTQSIGLGNLWKTIGNTGLRKMYRIANRKPSESIIPIVTNEAVQNIRSKFRDDILDLESILQRDLKSWLPQ